MRRTAAYDTEARSSYPLTMACLAERFRQCPNPLRNEASYAAVAIDFDGTLADTEETWRRAEMKLLQNHGVSPTREAMKVFFGLSLEQAGEALEKFLGTKGQGEQLVTELVNLAREQVLQAHLMPGARELLPYLASHAKLVVVSNGSPELIHEFLHVSNIAEMFSSVVTPHKLCHPKPMPCPYIEAAVQLDICPEQLLVLEDSSVGVESASRAGATVIGVGDQAGALADVHVSSLEDPRLMAIFNQALLSK